MAKTKSTRTADDDELLATWRGLCQHLYSLNERELILLLQKEYAGAMRPSFITTIHQRFNRLRAHRERQQLKKTGFAFSHLEGQSV